MSNSDPEFEFAAVTVCAFYEPGEEENANFSELVDKLAQIDIPEGLDYKDIYYAPDEEHEFEITASDGHLALMGNAIPGSSTIMVETEDINDETLHCHLQLKSDFYDRGMEFFEAVCSVLGEMSIRFITTQYQSEEPINSYISSGDNDTGLTEHGELVGNIYEVEQEGEDTFRFSLDKDPTGTQFVQHRHIDADPVQKSELAELIKSERESVEEKIQDII